MRCITQNMAMPPMAYGGTLSAQLGTEILKRRTRANNSNTAPINIKCPLSTPRLKNKSAVGMCPAGKPISVSPPAKPKPWISPNANATTHGALAAKPTLPRFR